MYKVKNITSEPRKFRDGQSGKDVVVEPNKSVVVDKAPAEHPSFSISEVKDKKPTKIEEDEE